MGKVWESVPLEQSAFGGNFPAQSTSCSPGSLAKWEGQMGLDSWLS